MQPSGARTSTAVQQFSSFSVFVAYVTCTLKSLPIYEKSRVKFDRQILYSNKVPKIMEGTERRGGSNRVHPEVDEE